MVFRISCIFEKYYRAFFPEMVIYLEDIFVTFKFAKLKKESIP